ncbi:MAG TPA: FtsX-like permease family protein [Pedococcus sp.]|nr:FtsX-like permease family protein [Pedococcus sp.]
MSLIWLRGLLRRRGARLAALAVGVAVSVALIAALGAFLSGSKATMTQRAIGSVATDWQVEIQPGADVAATLAAVRHATGVGTALPVPYAQASGLSAVTNGTTQTTGSAVVLGLPPGYRTAFPGQLRTLSGAPSGVLLAQQTAANLHAQPGTAITIQLPGGAAATVKVDGVVDLPQADTLFQHVGAPAGAQPSAPPDNVVLLPTQTFDRLIGARSGTAVVTQIHVRRSAPLPSDPAAAYEQVTAAAHHLEAQQSGAVRVGDNLAAALDAARSDAAYAQVLFLFLGAPGALLAALLTSALAATGGERRRAEQALLRLRGLTSSAVLRLAMVEAAVVGLAGGLLGLGLGALASRLAFGAGSEVSASATISWFAVAFVAGLVVAAATVVVPAVRDLRHSTVVAARLTVGRKGKSPWMRWGLDVILLAAAGGVFWASGSNNYSLVLAPEGVATISVSYWAFLGPALLWVGGALLLWRLLTLLMVNGRPLLGRALAPLTGRLTRVATANVSRQHRTIARSAVLLALALSFAASTAIFNATYQAQAEADAQLTNGADVTVTEPPSGTTGPQEAKALARVPGVRRVEPLQHRFAYVGADLQDLYGVRPQSITGVTALQDAYFQGGTAKALMRRLAAAPDSVLVSAETVKDFQLTPGDTLRLRLVDGRTHRLITVPFHYAGIVKEFPTAPKDSFFVANADYVAKATRSDAVGSFLLDTGGTGQPEVARAVRSLVGTSATVTDITTTRAQVGSSLTSVNLRGLTRLELFFAVLLAAGSGGIMLAVGLAERRRTTALLTVLGATAAERRRLLLSEAVVVAVGGLIGGALIGWALSAVLVKVLTGVFDPPPSAMALPWPYLTLTTCAVVAALGCAAALGTRPARIPAVEQIREL